MSNKNIINNKILSDLDITDIININDHDNNDIDNDFHIDFIEDNKNYSNRILTPKQTKNYSNDYKFIFPFTSIFKFNDSDDELNDPIKKYKFDSSKIPCISPQFVDMHYKDGNLSFKEMITRDEKIRKHNDINKIPTNLKLKSINSNRYLA